MNIMTDTPEPKRRGPRPVVEGPKVTLSFQVAEATVETIDTLSRELGQTRSEWVRRAVAAAVKAQTRKE